jgi:hypothetical protein
LPNSKTFLDVFGCAKAFILSVNINRGNMSPGQRAMSTTMLYPKTQSIKRKGAGSVAATDQGFSATSLSQARSAGR